MDRRKFFKCSLGAALASTACLQADAAQPVYTWIFVEDMHCANCAKRIARKLYTVPGVIRVQTDVEKDFAVVTPQDGTTISPRAVWEAAEKAKFTPIKLQDPSGVYTSKPAS